MRFSLKPACRQALVFLLAVTAAAVFPYLSRAADATFENSLGMTFALIPAGSFMMGSPENEAGRDADEALHEVHISKPFYLQTTEVTVGQWRSVMGSRWWKRDRESMKPMTKVSWFDCEDFVKRLNAMGEGTYRLPTEAEWEYACRAGSRTAYAWGDTLTCRQALFGNNSIKSPECIPAVKEAGLEPDGPAPVGSYPPNAWGLYDMHGNVWEWCLGWYGKYPAGPVTDPAGVADDSMKVRRGGSWFKGPLTCRSANRNFAHPASRYRTLGFRVLRVAD
ncbi:formylglycine-generating enzyme family protein [Desulfatiglans anilini]|uniref:formylglycine-generating enzyme family protein n=1 Tax=Desulfatiglans anilini TaxID=90728 RepID=UPI0004200F28|nr:formylglycine-generating enzyme family protein [Desulfatiglans anilini]